MRARPHYFWVLSQNEGAPPLMRARPHYFGCSPKPTSTHPLSKSPSSPSYLPATSADSSPPPIPRPWGDHTLLPQAKAKGTSHPSTHLGHVGSVCGLWPQCGQLETTQATTLTEVRIRQDFTSVPESSWLRRELHRKVQQTHTPPHTWGMVASVCGLWPQYGQLETTQAITLKSGSSRTSLQFLNLPGLGRNCIRSSVISAWGWGQGVLPACWVAYKSRPRRTSGQSTASDGHCHTPRGHNLNYTIWTLYAESVS